MRTKVTKKFTREQLVFIVDVMLSGARDRVESCLPPVIPQDEYQSRKQEIDNYIGGIVSTIAIQLPILYAQVTGDGMGAGDFKQFEQFEHAVENYLLQQTKQNGTYNGSGIMQDLSHLAKAFVDECFDEYLKERRSSPKKTVTPGEPTHLTNDDGEILGTISRAENGFRLDFDFELMKVQTEFRQGEHGLLPSLLVEKA